MSITRSDIRRRLENAVRLVINERHPHQMVIFQDDVTQCLDCGHWTRFGEEVLNGVPCPGDTEEIHTLAELELRP